MVGNYFLNYEPWIVDYRFLEKNENLLNVQTICAKFVLQKDFVGENIIFKISKKLVLEYFF